MATTAARDLNVAVAFLLPEPQRPDVVFGPETLHVGVAFPAPVIPVETIVRVGVALPAPTVRHTMRTPFDDDRLPVDIERGAVGGPTFSTRVSTTRSGHEQRNAEWQAPRQSWDVGYGIQSREDFQRVLTFFYARQGRLHAFRFRDWTDYEAEDAQYGVGDGQATTFQLSVPHVSGGRTYPRPVRLPINPVLGGDTTGVVDLRTGQVSFEFPPANGQALTWSGEFDLKVRFDTDEFQASVQHTDAIAVPSLPLIEVLE